jgi:hypothetical protein
MGDLLDACNVAATSFLDDISSPSILDLGLN